MKRRRTALLAVLAGLLVALAGALIWFFDAERRFACGIEMATGLPCSVGKIYRHPRLTFASGVKIGPPEAPYLELRVARISGPTLAKTKVVNVGPGSLAALRIPGLPAMTFDQDNKFHILVSGLDSLRGTPDADPLEVRVSGDCRELAPLLERFGKIDFLSGGFVLSACPGPGRRKLDFPVRVVLTDVHVRGPDGRFEVQAEEARATVRVTGSVDDPRLDLGELEPWLGAEFVNAFRKPGS